VLIADLEQMLVREAKCDAPDAFHRLRSVPGIGPILALTILYEIYHIGRFDRVQEFASYARLVKCAHQSAGKTLGTGGAKMGNVHLKWAFSEAAALFLRHAHAAPVATFMGRLEKHHGKAKALSILAHKIGRAVFYMLARGTSSRCPSPSRRSGRERVSHTPHSSHGTELAAIVTTWAPGSASDDPESLVRQRAALMGRPLPFAPPPRTRSMRRPSPEPGDYGRAPATSSS
jgi:hypothetical protein